MMIVERMFDEERGIQVIESGRCACTACPGQLTNAALSAGGWGFCRICRCAWKVSAIDGHQYATTIPSPLHAGQSPRQAAVGDRA
jgi:hypothetical protein